VEVNFCFHLSAGGVSSVENVGILLSGETSQHSGIGSSANDPRTSETVQVSHGKSKVSGVCQNLIQSDVLQIFSLVIAANLKHELF